MEYTLNNETIHEALSLLNDLLCAKETTGEINNPYPNSVFHRRDFSGGILKMI
jgi:hypothetical protein